MEIQKIFSNVENETEKLYSVLMSEGEYNLFSEHKKDQEDNFRKKLNDEYKKNNRKRNISHAVLGGR